MQLSIIGCQIAICRNLSIPLRILEVSILALSLPPVKKVIGRYVPVPVIPLLTRASVLLAKVTMFAALVGSELLNAENPEVVPVPFGIA
jgi:hypothetical protein